MTLHDSQSETTPLKVPRLDSLLHKLQHAKDAEGRPIPLLDELLFFLDDPPPKTGDRWQKGANLCAEHGIKTSRMSVHRLFRSEIMRWRREQNPAPPAPPPDPVEIERLHDQARHLAAQRAVDSLNDPRLSPAHLIGFIQKDNDRRRIQLARDKFTDVVTLRHDLARHKMRKAVEEEARIKAMAPAQAAFVQKFMEAMAPIPPHTTP